MPARAIGSGTVSFGLVSIPIKVYTTKSSSKDVSFNMLHESCGSRLKQQYTCPECNEVVPRSAMVKGYEFAKSKYVKFSSDELKAIEAVSNNAIELAEFVPADTVDSVYFDKTYYLGPDKGGERAYGLLGASMRETGLVGLAKYSSRGKQYLVMVRPYGEQGLVMQQLRYHDEVKAFDDVPLSDAPDIAGPELDLAIQIIEQIAGDEFAPEKYSDDVKQRVLALIQKKVDGEEITAEKEAPKGEIIDLMEALKASLGAVGAEDDAAADRKPARSVARSDEGEASAKQAK